MILNIAIVRVSSTIWIWPKCFVCFYIYFTSNLSDEAFELPLSMWCVGFKIDFLLFHIFHVLFESLIFHSPLNRMPFDWKNPIGYLVAAIIQHLICIAIFSVVACLASYGIGAFLFGIFTIKDIKTILKSINDSAQTKKTERQAMEYLDDYIQCHTKLKRLSKIGSIAFKSIEISNYSFSSII